jgi:hypothetical protein
MKAVTPKGEIVGWTCWSFSGFEYDGTDHATTEFQVETPMQKEKESEVKNVEETKAV